MGNKVPKQIEIQHEESQHTAEHKAGSGNQKVDINIASANKSDAHK